MRAQPVAASQNRRIVGSLPFVEALARRMAASMPNSIDIGDLVQDGVLGLIDAAEYQAGTIVLRPGEALAIVSDGVTEALTPDDREFGDERVFETLAGALDRHRIGSG